MATQPAIEIIANHPDIVGECPTWDANRSSLLWTDNRAQRIYRYTPATGTIDTVVQGHAVYAFTLQQDGSLLLFLNNTRVAHAGPNGVDTVIENLPGEANTRFNDVIVDRRGRVICGVLPTEGVSTGSLYSLAPNGQPTKLHEGLTLPNGMAFSPDDRLLYVADTRARIVLVFDYDLPSGAVENPRTFATFTGDSGSPDGLTVDTDAHVWIAATGGGSILRIAPDGTLDRTIALDARKPTSVGFGGDRMSTLYITSSSRESTPGEQLGPAAGALFAVQPDATGRPEHRSNFGGAR